MAKILIVDDALIMRNILRVMLEKAGHEIVGNATNGKEAMEIYKAINPELVTVDIQMTGGSGMAFLKKLIQFDADARVIMVSTLDDDQINEKARDLGAIGLVSKPFRIENLLKEVQAALVE